MRGASSQDSRDASRLDAEASPVKELKWKSPLRRVQTGCATKICYCRVRERAAKRGLWRNDVPTERWDFRHVPKIVAKVKPTTDQRTPTVPSATPARSTTVQLEQPWRVHTGSGWMIFVLFAAALTAAWLLSR